MEEEERKFKDVDDMDREEFIEYLRYHDFGEKDIEIIIEKSAWLNLN